MSGFRIYFVLIIAVLVGFCAGAPSMGGETNTCFGEVCPPRTTGCKKITKTSADKQSLDVTISCLDVQDYELKKFTKPEPNPYGPHTHYESSSFSASYSYSGGNLKPININHNNHIGNHNDVEDFS
ncbi:hypothetical protein WA026_000482 [Henosepilachna vigintioctopunctata]|uniref:Uncharacterized protein n=1 Tax=Henosepilachna vigintioctopunctata TaxID=420089 RepID=A0AAW1V880_9CUCU